MLRSLTKIIWTNLNDCKDVQNMWSTPWNNSKRMVHYNVSRHSDVAKAANIFWYIYADSLEKEEKFNAIYNSFDVDEIDKRLWQGIERIMVAWASEGGSRGTLPTWIFNFDIFLLTFQWENIFLSVLSWQEILTLLTPCKDGINHNLENSTASPLCKITFRRLTW